MTPAFLILGHYCPVSIRLIYPAVAVDLYATSFAWREMENQHKYQSRAIVDLIPYARNARVHSDNQIAQIAASIREFGFTNPVLIDGDGGIIAGHGRVMAARKLGMDSIPCVVLSDLTEMQKRAYILVDNKLALNAGWDDDLLRLEFDELEEMGIDLELTGFSLGEIGVFDAEEVPMPSLTDGEKDPYQQKTFTLHDDQAAIVDDAVMLARTDPLVDTGVNKNSNGNALALVCREWLDYHHV